MQILNVHCDSNTVACRKHKGVVGWLCTKLEGSVGKLDLAIRKYYRMLFNRCTWHGAYTSCCFVYGRAVLLSVPNYWPDTTCTYTHLCICVYMCACARAHLPLREIVCARHRERGNVCVCVCVCVFRACLRSCDTTAMTTKYWTLIAYINL